MDYLTESPIITETNLEKNKYNNFLSEIPNLNSKPNFVNFLYPYTCGCHCHSRALNLHLNFSNSQIEPINSELFFGNKYNLYPRGNKSMNNIFSSQNNNLFEDKLRLRFHNNFNKKTIFEYKRKKYYNTYNNDKFKFSRNYSYPNLKIKNNSKNENISDNIYNNYNFKSVKIKGGDMHNNYNKNLEINDINQSIFLKKYNIKPFKSFQIKRKELTKYYHTSNPKKYSYGGEKLQTVNYSDNHQYKEVMGTSASKDNNMKKSRVINLNNIKNSDNNINITNDKIKIEINNDISDAKANNQKFYNSRYKSYQNSPRNISRKLSYEPKEKKSELNQRIIKETYNTRLFESKELKASKTNNYLYDVGYENNYINNIRNVLNFDTNNYLYRKGNKYNINNLRNPNYNYKEGKKNDSKYIPKSYSVNNLDNLKYSNSYNLKNQYKKAYDNNNFSNNYSKNNDYNNLDYELIKLKVKLALLRKQMYEQEKERIFNNKQNLMNMNYYNDKKYLEKFLSKENKNPRIINDNSLILKTKKLLEEKRLRNKQRELIKNMNNNKENKILYSLKKNLRDKNNDYNKNSIIKPKLKVWKP